MGVRHIEARGGVAILNQVVKEAFPRRWLLSQGFERVNCGDSLERERSCREWPVQRP